MSLFQLSKEMTKIILDNNDVNHDLVIMSGLPMDIADLADAKDLALNYDNTRMKRFWAILKDCTLLTRTTIYSDSGMREKILVIYRIEWSINDNWSIEDI